jgi:hypothetical protein
MEKKKKTVQAAPEAPQLMSETQAQAELLKHLRPFHEDAMLQIEDLEASGKITRDTASAHRTQLLQRAGIDLTKAPIVVYENVSAIQPTPAALPMAAQDPVSSRPVVGHMVTPVVDLTGFYSAASVGAIVSANSTLVGAMARAVGIFEKETPTNEHGCWTPLNRNGILLKKHWVYSEKSKTLLTTLLMKYMEIRRANPSRKLRQKDIVEQVTKEWLKDQTNHVPAQAVN